MRSAFATFATIVFAAGILGAPAPRSAPLDSIRSYRSWYSDTPQAIDMDAAIAMRCAPGLALPKTPDPHARYLFKIWVNPAGKAAFQSKKPIPFPGGSIVVKEKFNAAGLKRDSFGVRVLPPDARPILLTAMVKREPGFNPDAGDWEYVTLRGDASSPASEHFSQCAVCHHDAKPQDYVFRRHCESVRAGPSHLKT